MNVEVEAKNPDSMLSLYRELLALRRERTALSTGRYVPLQASGDVLAYARESASERFVIALNLGPEPAETSLACRCRVVLSTHGDRDGEPLREPLRLRGDEGILALEE